MKLWFPCILLIIAVATTGCGPAQSSVATPVPPTPVPTTATPMPPTATPMPTRVPLPATDTVCSDGCDFATIQAAIDDEGTADGAIIEVRDAVHTEAGIVVDKDITIRGLGADATIVQGHAEAGNGTERVFHIEKGASATIKGLTIRHGYPSSSPHAGGGIWNQGALLLEDSAVRNNTAADGGGVWNQGELTVVNCAINSNVSDGIAPPGYECGSGGGINNGGGGTLTLINSTVSYNKAAGKSGGIHVACEGTVALINSTISHNKAATYGGGAFIGQIGTLNCTESTVSENTSGDAGSGIYIRGTLNYTDTTIAGCVIGGPGDYRGSGVVGVHNNTKVEENDCEPASGFR